MKLASYSTTTAGRRQENEDSVWDAVFAPPLGCVDAAVVLADGMGGSLGGGHASRRAVDLFREQLTKHPPTRGELEPWLGDVFSLIHDELIRESSAEVSLRGMGTTLVAGLASGNDIVVAHVGDSRAYVIHGDKAELLTRDHSAVQDAIDRGLFDAAEVGRIPEAVALGSALIGHLGEGGRPTPDVRRVRAVGYGLLLVCSDGLTGSLVRPVLESEELLKSVVGHTQLSVSAENLLRLALRKGSTDNISVGLLELGSVPRAPDVGQAEPRPVKSPGDRVRSSAVLRLPHAVMVILLGSALAGGLAGIGWMLKDELPVGRGRSVPRKQPRVLSQVEDKGVSEAGTKQTVVLDSIASDLRASQSPTRAPGALGSNSMKMSSPDTARQQLPPAISWGPLVSSATRGTSRILMSGDSLCFIFSDMPSPKTRLYLCTEGASRRRHRKELTRYAKGDTLTAAVRLLGLPPGGSCRVWMEAVTGPSTLKSAERTIQLAATR